MKLVGLSGAARSGKDTVASMLFNNYGLYPVGFADALKSAAAVLLNRPESEMYGDDGFDREALLPEWGFSTRHFLQVLGTEGCRKLFREDFWINRLALEIKDKDEVVISDVRFENEANFVRTYGGEIWHIVRPVHNGLNEEAQAHASEMGIRMEDSDRVLFNNGTLDDLEKRVDRLWTSFV